MFKQARAQLNCVSWCILIHVMFPSPATLPTVPAALSTWRSSVLDVDLYEFSTRGSLLLLRVQLPYRVKVDPEVLAYHLNRFLLNAFCFPAAGNTPAGLATTACYK